MEDVGGAEQPVAAPLPLVAVAEEAPAPLPTGQPGLDEVLGGGLRRSSVALLVGEPGAGKSTLLLQALQAVAESGTPALWATAEEPLDQVCRRARRLGVLDERLLVLAATSAGQVEEAVVATKAGVVVVDSLQALAAGLGGGPSKVGHCLEALVVMARRLEVAVVAIGQVRKDGAMAGPRSLEHLVDTVVRLEGDRHSSRRRLRALKHRHGEVGPSVTLELSPTGLRPVGDAPVARGASRLGSAFVPVVGPSGVVVTEVEALVVPGHGALGATGLLAGRVRQVAAALQASTGWPLSGRDLYVAALGGAKVVDPAADLAVAVALASALSGVSVCAAMVVAGEVAPSGALRAVPGIGRRLAEAARRGFRQAVVPAEAGEAEACLEVLAAPTLRRALELSWHEGATARRPGLGFLAGPLVQAASTSATAGRPTVPEGAGGTIRRWWSTTGTGR